MDNLLLFFALPLATIIIAIVLESVWRNFWTVTAFIFAIFLIVTFAVFDAEFFVFAVAYTILALISSFLSMTVRRICRILRANSSNNGSNSTADNENDESFGMNNNLDANNKLTIIENGRNTYNDELLKLQTGNTEDNKCYNNTQNIPDTSTYYRRGNYRRFR